MQSIALSITKRIADLAEPILDELGFELVDIEYLSKHGRWVLRIYIDKEGGVTIDDCARVSGEFGDLIDIKEVIEHEYVLEVSSPGLNRPLKKEIDFVLPIKRKLIPIESKYRGKIPNETIESIKEFIKEKNSPFGIVITKDEFGLIDNILKIPLWVFLLVV